MFSIWQNQPVVALTPQVNIADAASCRRSFLSSLLLPTGEAAKQYAEISLGLKGDHAAHAVSTARGVSGGDSGDDRLFGSYQDRTPTANRQDARINSMRFVPAG